MGASRVKLRAGSLASRTPPHRWRSTPDVTAHPASRRWRSTARHPLAHLERLPGGEGGAAAAHPDVGRFLVRDRIEDALPVGRGVALGEVPGCVLEDRTPGRDL